MSIRKLVEVFMRISSPILHISLSFIFTKGDRRKSRLGHANETKRTVTEKAWS